jgi:hypothetical protein
VKDEEWEEVQGDESAENGAAETDTAAGKVETEESKPRVQLPDVPTGEPVEEGRATKKHKSDGGES